MMKSLRLLIAFPVLEIAQETLSNDSIVKIVKAGLAESLIASMIQYQLGRYSLTPDDLVSLKQQGVSEKLRTAMVAKGIGTPPTSSANSGPTTASDAHIPAGIDIGMFYKSVAGGRKCFRRSLIGRPAGLSKASHLRESCKAILTETSLEITAETVPPRR